MIELVKHPNPILKATASPVADLQRVKSLVDQAAELMYVHNGVGLAAPQIGVLERFVLVDPTAGESARSLKVMINPVIDYRSVETTADLEGCLSLPGTEVMVVRPSVINVSYTNLDGYQIKEIMVGREARIAQHEIDHLDGITLLQRVSKRKR